MASRCGTAAIQSCWLIFYARVHEPCHSLAVGLLAASFSEQFPLYVLSSPAPLRLSFCCYLGVRISGDVKVSLVPRYAS